MYVRTDIGGAYGYDPFSNKWTPLNDIFSATDWNLMRTESIAVNPVQPGRVYLAQGTYTQSWAGNRAILASDNFGLPSAARTYPSSLAPTRPDGIQASVWGSILRTTTFCIWDRATTVCGRVLNSAALGIKSRHFRSPVLPMASASFLLSFSRPARNRRKRPSMLARRPRTYRFTAAPMASPGRRL